MRTVLFLPTLRCHSAAKAANTYRASCAIRSRLKCGVKMELPKKTGSSWSAKRLPYLSSALFGVNHNNVHSAWADRQEASAALASLAVQKDADLAALPSERLGRASPAMQGDADLAALPPERELEAPIRGDLASASEREREAPERIHRCLSARRYTRAASASPISV